MNPQHRKHRYAGVKFKPGKGGGRPVEEPKEELPIAGGSLLILQEWLNRAVAEVYATMGGLNGVAAENQA